MTTVTLDREAFVAYLVDHLAGSEAGLVTARRLRRRHPSEEVGASMEQMVSDIEREQSIVREAISLLGSSTAPASVVVKVSGVASSVLVWARRSLPGRVPSVLEDLEALAVGVWGKRLLWGALIRAAEADPRLADLEAARLADGAEEQERLLLRLRDDALDDLFA